MNATQLRNVALIIEALEKLDTKTTPGPNGYEDVYLAGRHELKSEDGRVGYVERIDAGIWSFKEDRA